MEEEERAVAPAPQLEKSSPAQVRPSPAELESPRYVVVADISDIQDQINSKLSAPTSLNSPISKDKSQV